MSEAMKFSAWSQTNGDMEVTDVTIILNLGVPWMMDEPFVINALYAVNTVFNNMEFK